MESDSALILQRPEFLRYPILLRRKHVSISPPRVWRCADVHCFLKTTLPLATRSGLGGNCATLVVGKLTVTPSPFTLGCPVPYYISSSVSPCWFFVGLEIWDEISGLRLLHQHHHTAYFRCSSCPPCQHTSNQSARCPASSSTCTTSWRVTKSRTSN